MPGVVCLISMFPAVSRGGIVRSPSAAIGGLAELRPPALEAERSRLAPLERPPAAPPGGVARRWEQGGMFPGTDCRLETQSWSGAVRR